MTFAEIIIGIVAGIAALAAIVGLLAAGSYVVCGYIDGTLALRLLAYRSDDDGGATMVVSTAGRVYEYAREKHGSWRGTQCGTKASVYLREALDDLEWAERRRRELGVGR